MTQKLNLTAQYQIDGAGRAVSSAMSDIRCIGLSTETTRFKSHEERKAYIADRIAEADKAIRILADACIEL